MVQTLFSANIPRKMRNFAPSKRKMRISSRPKKLLLFVNLFVWLNPKKLWLRWPLFPISWLNYAEESTLTADKVLPHFAETSWRPWEYFRKRMKISNGRQSTRCCRTEYSHGRQSACYDCGNTPTADRVPDTTGQSTLTGDRVLAKTAEIRLRPTEYFRNLSKHRDGRQSTRCERMEYYNGRENT